ncbi:MAG: hypothetical protein IT431_05890 [Phycisphaerales bacterium]|nr:hypothetical protein [Phycisphaerales bacterium]
MANQSKGQQKAASQTEPKLLFRADTDQNGDWYVWRRLGTNGWATMRRCDCRDDAEQLAASMNLNPKGSVLGR